ncbi:MAG TPA: HAMP domain-containing sensor histidine kinase [Thermotogota bacterium]|nr:HAMP domain-containing sensor histidine kinase [Thermotogota bacterium]HPR97040.1 HAMP domain-containing sensor histidine kinase [Thermotogota bacterium]
MNLHALNPVRDGIIRLDHMTVKDLNDSAKAMGFKRDSDIFSCVSFDQIDQLTRSIILSEYFETKANIYFFNNVSQYSKVIYNPIARLLFIIDLSEDELLKKVKSDVVMSISHELRTPLSVAIGNVQMLKDFSSTPENEKMIKKTQDSLNKLEKIISQLSLLTQAEFGSYSIRYEIFDPALVIEEVLSDYSKKIQTKKLKISVQCEPETFKADRFVVYTILRNLISNAIKYSHPESIIEVAFTDEMITIKDSGMGIREEEIPRVFERFFRGTEALKSAKGSGLGLPLVKYLCGLCGYKVWFTTKWMIGTTFFVKFDNEE